MEQIVGLTVPIALKTPNLRQNVNNKAKCKLCQSVIESFHRFDLVSCKCGEISISGGSDVLECSAKDFGNFLRIDDLGNEIIVKLVDKDSPKDQPNPETTKPTRKELIEMLEGMLKNIESLPQNAMSLPINHYDFYTHLLVVLAILKDDL